MNAPTPEPEVLSTKLFLIVIGGAVAFLVGIATVMALMPGK